MTAPVIQVGDAVRSKAGRDIGRLFIVTELEGEYALICDGDLRKLAKPKKKKLRHIGVLPRECAMAPVTEGSKLCDADYRRHIKSLNDNL